ncbi:MAG: hypothetical protein ACLQBQ_09545 [Smithella sp.]
MKQLSGFLSIDIKDVLHGAVLAFIVVIATALMPVLSSGTLPTLAVLQSAGSSGLAAGIAYLFKAFLTNPNGDLGSGTTTSALQG